MHCIVVHTITAAIYYVIQYATEYLMSLLTLTGNCLETYIAQAA
jgi:hypothetical protein